MRLPSVFNATGISVFFITLSLSFSGIARGVADVESRSSSTRQGIEADEQISLELLKKIEFLQQEVQELRGKVEEQTYNLQQLQDHQKKLYLDLDKRLRSNSSTAANTSPLGNSLSGSSLDSMGEQTTALPLESSESEEKAYQTAYYLIQNKDYDGALRAFQMLATSYPQGKYLPNAYYWLGEIYLVKGNLDLAADSFNKVYSNYPGHPKAADSLLKLGYVEYSKGQWKQAEQFLVQVKNQFPGSTSAQLADARLQKMQQEGHL